MALSSFQAVGNHVLREVPAVAVIAWIEFLGELTFAEFFKSLGRAEAVVRMPQPYKAAGLLMVDLQPL